MTPAAQPQANRLDRRQQADQPLDGEVLRRDRHDQGVGGDQRVDADERQIRGAVEDDDVVALADALQERASASARGPGTSASTRSALASSTLPVMRSRFGTFVERIACCAGNSCSRQDSRTRAGAARDRRQATATRTPGCPDRPATRVGAATRARPRDSRTVVVLPTPPLLLTTAMTTWDLSVILSTNVMAGVSGTFSGTAVVCGAPVTRLRWRSAGGRRGHASAASMATRRRAMWTPRASHEICRSGRLDRLLERQRNSTEPSRQPKLAR